ncbi:surface presentation of antigens (SPOA) protein [Rhizobium sp. PDO1-076]|nr:surface presentation of antigens (SPOA) protein [Rhizobium sp. PDO1-076]
MSYGGRLLPIGEGDTELSFMPIPVRTKTDGMRKLYLDNCEVALVGIEAFPFGSVFGVALEISDLEGMPSELADALRVGMVMAVLSDLPDNLSARISLVADGGADVGLLSPKLPGLQWFSCSLSGLAEEPIIFTFAAEPDVICAELSKSGPLVGRINSAVDHLVTVPAQRIIGTASLSLAELHGLAPGDCMLFTASSSEDQLAVLVKHLVYIFSMGDAGSTCARVLPFDRLLMKEPLDSLIAEDSALTSLDEQYEGNLQNVNPESLEVSVAFCLGSTSLPICELQDWQPGSVVTLPDNLSVNDVLVAVQVNGRTVAQGDLVRIEDRLAVRLNRVLLDPPNRIG